MSIPVIEYNDTNRIKEAIAKNLFFHIKSGDAIRAVNMIPTDDTLKAMSEAEAIAQKIHSGKHKGFASASDMLADMGIEC